MFFSSLPDRSFDLNVSSFYSTGRHKPSETHNQHYFHTYTHTCTHSHSLTYEQKQRKCMLIIPGSFWCDLSHKMVFAGSRPVVRYVFMKKNFKKNKKEERLIRYHKGKKERKKKLSSPPTLISPLPFFIILSRRREKKGRNGPSIDLQEYVQKFCFNH